MPITNQPERFDAGVARCGAATAAGDRDVAPAPGRACSCGSTASTIATRPRRCAARRSRPSRSATPPPGEVWVHELIGAEVRDRAGAVLGRVVAVEANPAHDLLVLDSGALDPDGVRRRARRRARSSSTSPKASSTCERATMRIDVFTLFPEYLAGPLQVSLVGKAQRGGPPRRARPRPARRGRPTATARVDDRPFGGGAGMVLMPEPLFAAVEAVEPPRPLLLLSASGRRFDQRAGRAARARSPGSRCCAAATKASTSGSPTTCATASCRSATTCSPAARRPRWSSSKR